MRGADAAGRPRARPVSWMWTIVAALCIALAACGGPATARQQTPPTPTATAGMAAAGRIDGYLTAETAARRFSGAVLVASHGTVLLRKGYGMSDMALGAPNRPETRFRIASLTKQFTATAILLLRERGKLSLDDPVCRYLDGCPEAWEPITLKMCLTHTSGIPNLADGDIADYTQPLAPGQLLALIQAKPLDFAPGTRFEYSNAGYNVLGAVIERASGEPYARFLRDAIFAPLHMDATGYDTNRPPSPEHATGYATWGQPAGDFDITLPFAAGGVASTVDDLYIWDRALAGHTLLSRASEDEMLAAQVGICAGDAACPPSAAARGYGYGWFVESGAFGTVEYHVGDLLGYKSLIARYPGRDATVIVLANLETVDAEGTRAQMERLLFQGA